MNPLAFNDSPFQKAAIDFALNNSAGSAFKAFLSSPEGQSPTTTSIVTTTSSVHDNTIVSDATNMLMSTPSTASSSSSLSDTQQLDGLFKIPQLPSLRRFSGCNFCGSLTSQDRGSLMKCDGCKTTLYCSEEHRSFDWKRHKPLCRTFQMRTNRSLSNLNPVSTISQSETMDMSGPIKPTAIRPPIDQPFHDFLPKSISASSIYSFGASSSGVSSVLAVTTSERSAKSDNRSTDSAVGVDASDPDIQIIKSNDPPRKPRKRPLDTDENCHNAKWKDHSKNFLFKTSLQDHMKYLAASGMALNQHQAIALRLRYIAEHVIRSLNEYGWAVVDNFLGKTHCKYTYLEVEELYRRGLFKEGQLIDRKEPNDSIPTTAKDIRSDEIYWFDSSECKAKDAVTIRLLISMIDSVIVHFAKRIPPYTIGGRSRAMIACYPGNGTRYVKHVDNPIRDGRCVTSIYYCNENWMLAEDGGTLRLYPETSEVPMDIDPRADRLIFFWSDYRNPHEVLPVFRPRYAITIWYFDEAEKNEALERQKRSPQNSLSRKSTSPDMASAGNSNECMSAALFHSDVNSAPTPQKPNSPQISSVLPPVNTTMGSSHSPTLQWRQAIRMDDGRSISTRSMLDEEEDENLIVDVENTDQQDSAYIPNFEV